MRLFVLIKITRDLYVRKSNIKREQYMKTLRIFLLFLLVTTNVSGNKINNIRFSHLNIQQGLPQNTVNCIAQDNQGFIWLGTRNGLCRYDGYFIKTYFNTDGDTLSLTSNFIISIHRDKAGRLWVISERGICQYNQLTDKFKRYNLWNGQKVLRGNLFFEAQSGQMYVTIFNEIYRYDSATDSFKRMLDAQTLKRNLSFGVLSLAIDGNDVMWIGTQNGLRWYDLRTQTFFNPIYNNELGKKLENKQINRFYRDKWGRMWIGTTENGVFVYNPASQSIIEFNTLNGLTNNNISAICQDDEQKIWVGTEHGINIIDNQLHLIKKFEQNENDLSNLSDNAIYSIFSDNASNVWIGTFFGGLNIFYKGSDGFSIYPYGYLSKHLSGKAVRQIIANNATSLWIATEDGGLNFFDKNTGDIQHYSSGNGKIKLTYHNIHSLLKDNHNNLWIGTFTGGLNCYNISSGKTTYYTPMNKKMPSPSIFSLLQDSSGTIWAGTTNGLTYLNTSTDQFVRFNHAALGNEFIYCLFLDSYANIWVGTRSQGLFCFNPQTKLIKKIKLFGKTENFITSITEDKKKQIWVGTNNSGISCVYKNQEIKQITQLNGLLSNSVKGVIEDNGGNIWISTEAGLCRYNQATNKVENFTVNDGLPINQFNFSSAFKAEDGELYFGTINGMISFYPNKLIPNKKIFDVQFTDFKLSGKSVRIGDKKSPLKKNISETEKIVLTHNQSTSFSFEFTGLNFKYAPSTLYAMRLVGADSDWQIINKQRQILFSSLPSGKYILQIKASIDGINWDESGMRSLEIVILPPFWKSWWAYIIYTILMLLIGYSIFNILNARLQLRIKLQAEHAEKLQLEELNRHKINFFTFITHDLKTPLTLILSPIQRLINSNDLQEDVRKKLDVILKNAKRMNHLIDELMTFSKIEMKHTKITVNNGDALLFIYDISTIFEMVAVEREIDFTIDIPVSQKESVWFSPSHLERIIYNLLSNAFKYTPIGGAVSLSASLEHIHEEVFLNIVVEDSGRGIPKHLLEKIFENYYQVEQKDRNEGAGIGLALTKVLVNIHKGSIRAESELAYGTRFIVRLNVSESVFEDDEKSPEKIDEETFDKNKSHIIDSVKLFSETIPIQQKTKDRKMKILVVEDNADMNDYVTDIFEKSFDTIKAYNGKEAYNKVITEVPDLIISDVMMPEMDGLELTSKLKSHLSFSHIPMVLLTAKNMEDDFTEGYKSGADAYIVKPFNAENLELLVTNLLKTHQSNIEKFKYDDNSDVHEIVTNPRDEKFMSDLITLIMNNLDNEDFDVTEITTALGVSRSLLHIKLKKLTDASVTEFIRQIKMKEARKLLSSGHNVSETSYAVGMSDPNYFSKCFKKYTGVNPSEFIKDLNQKRQTT